MCHFRCPWNGMFDCHRAEIAVMQFTGHSLPVHQSMTVPWDFTLSHIVSQTRLRQWNMQLPRLLNGMSGRVKGQYKTNESSHLLPWGSYIYIYICVCVCTRVLKIEREKERERERERERECVCVCVCVCVCLPTPPHEQEATQSQF